jgi:shikimate 5-dehydrogenase
MSQLISKDTKIYCSFSKNAGNKGCKFFNPAFYKYNINAIYKAFSVDNIDDALNCAKFLKFNGCGIAMPFKKRAFELVDEKDISATNSKSVNTIVFDYNSNKLKGYNTDYYATEKLLENHIKHKKIYILGNGGLCSSVKAKSKEMGFDIINITRNDWHKIQELKNSLIFNCTPVTNIILDKSNIFIDCIIGSFTGDLFHQHQSRKQFEIYTGIKYEL